MHLALASSGLCVLLLVWVIGIVTCYRCTAYHWGKGRGKATSSLKVSCLYFCFFILKCCMFQSWGGTAADGHIFRFVTETHRDESWPADLCGFSIMFFSTVLEERNPLKERKQNYLVNILENEKLCAMFLRMMNAVIRSVLIKHCCLLYQEGLKAAQWGDFCVKLSTLPGPYIPTQWGQAKNITDPSLEIQYLRKGPLRLESSPGRHCLSSAPL